MFTLGLGIPAVGLLSFYMVAMNGQYGSFAKSPQTAKLTLGGSVIVGGGRAKLWFREVDGNAWVEVSCKNDTKVVEIPEDETTEEVCGIRMRRLDLDLNGPHPPRVKLEVTWDEKKK